MKNVLLLSMVVLLGVSLAGCSSSQVALGSAASCPADYISSVAANGECLVIKTYGQPGDKRTSLVVFIHGDDSKGGASDYMNKIAWQTAKKGVVSIALIRPGYYDSNGNHSTGQSFRSTDSYRPKIIDTVAAAVKALKNYYKADFVVLVGRSGGAAISGVIIGKYPNLANAAVLGGCPCNVARWRIKKRGENTWIASLSPHNFVDGVAKGTRVIAVTGSKDTNTNPILAKKYVNSLKDGGINATFIEALNGNHKNIESQWAFRSAISQVLDGQY